MPNRRIDQLRNQLSHLMNKLSNWKVVYANWQLGTRDGTDGAFQAIQDAKLSDLNSNIKLDALVQLLIERGLISEEALLAEQIEVANKLEKSLEAKFPGATATDTGMVYDESAFENTKEQLGFPV